MKKKKTLLHIGKLFRKLAVRKILLNLKKTKVIKDYHGDKVVAKESFGFSVQIINGIWYSFLVSKSEHALKLGSIGKQGSRNAILFVNSDCKPKTLKILMLQCLHAVQKGVKAENDFDADLKKLWNSDKSFSKAVTAWRKASPDDDMFRGIDRELYYEGVWVPIQIKTKTKDQNRHKNKFFSIPSLVYNKSLYESGKLKKFLLQICESYLRNIPEHLRDAA